MRISRKVAKLAKEKGFNLPCSYSYGDDSGMSVPIIGSHFDWNSTPKNQSAPRQWELESWLRKVHKIHVTTGYYVKFYPIVLDIRPDGLAEGIELDIDTKEFEVFEEAVEHGLLEALKHIK